MPLAVQLCSVQVEGSELAEFFENTTNLVDVTLVPSETSNPKLDPRLAGSGFQVLFSLAGNAPYLRRLKLSDALCPGFFDAALEPVLRSCMGAFSCQQTHSTYVHPCGSQPTLAKQGQWHSHMCVAPKVGRRKQRKLQIGARKQPHRTDRPEQNPRAPSY
jgi:hypothetical protein